MTKKHLILLMLILLAMPMVAGAQALFDAQKIVKPVSPLFPIIPDNEIVGTPDSLISKTNITKIYDRCMSRVPDRFTPDAHKYYCTCTAAATQATINNGELRTLQKTENRTIKNKTFEKYVLNVVKPCMDQPVEDVEYMYCVMNRSNDWRIQLPLPFCKCVSRAVVKKFREHGEEDILIQWGTGKDTPPNPFEALWNNDNFSAIRETEREECVGAYLNPEFTRN